MSSRRKGRRFELDLYNELKEMIPDISMSKWSGSQADEPGDMYSNTALFEVKRIKRASENKIMSWFDKLLEELATTDQKYPVLIVKEDFRAPVVYINLNMINTIDCVIRLYYDDFKRLVTDHNILE